MKISNIKKQKLIIYFAVGLVLSFAFLESVLAQNKTITKEELETKKSNAAKKLEKIRYQSVTSQKNESAELTSIYKFVPPDREHFLITIKYAESLSEKLEPFQINVNKYEEWIYIGDKVYFRNAANKKWEKITTDGGIGSGIGIGIGTVLNNPIETIEYKLTPNQLVNGAVCELYEVIQTIRFSWTSETLVYNYKYWINKNGLFAKTQNISSDSEKTVDYEYNSNIKIEAPLIKKRRK